MFQLLVAEQGCSEDHHRAGSGTHSVGSTEFWVGTVGAGAGDTLVPASLSGTCDREEPPRRG
jgi:hypothetical protein